MSHWSSAPDDWILDDIRACLLARMTPSRVLVSPQTYRWLIDQSCSPDLTVRGQDRPIWQAYQCDHPEGLEWWDVQDERIGKIVRAAALTRRVLVHMRCLKKSFGVSHIDGVPIEVVQDGPMHVVVREPWEAVA